MRNKSVFLAIMILLFGCSLMNNNKSTPWSGVYRGVLPCADCEGIQTEIRLYPNNTFEMLRKYLGESDKIYRDKGKVKWNESENQIRLRVKEEQNIPANYRVSENQIIQLDANGDTIQSDFSESYVLKKAATIR